MSKVLHRCPACRNSLHKRLSTSKLTLYDCHKCQLLHARVSNKKGGDYYDFFEPEKFEAYYKTFRKKTFKKNWKEIQRYKKKGKALDVGASAGWFLDVQPKGWVVNGIEKYSSAVPLKYKKNIKHVDIYDLAFHSSYDVITMWNVIEHLENPNKALKIIHNALNTDGILGISFPNSSGLISRMSYFLFDMSFGLIKNQLYTLFQVDSSSPHLFHFNENNMRIMLEKNGFMVLSIGRQRIIDPANIDKRMQIEKKKTSIILSITAKIVAYILVYASSVFDMHDEVIIYSRKI